MVGEFTFYLLFYAYISLMKYQESQQREITAINKILNKER